MGVELTARATAPRSVVCVAGTISNGPSSAVTSDNEMFTTSVHTPASPSGGVVPGLRPGLLPQSR